MRRNFHPDGRHVNELTLALRRYRLKANSSLAISRECWLDESYISRLFSGERSHPSRDALILLAASGMRLSLEATDELLMAADYKPLVLANAIR